MEGKFLTKDQRVNMAQQIRKTHFTLGGGCKSYNTTTQNFLKPPAPNPSEFQKDLSKDLRKTHLQIGNDNPKKASEFTVSYPPKPLQGNLPDMPKTDLKKHNAVLGTTSNNYNTEVSLNYKPAFVSVQDVESAKRIERNLRGHHFKLGTDQPTQKSTFSADYETRPGEKVSEITETKKDLRKSHFNLGNGPKMMKSTSHQDYVKLKIEASAGQNSDLRKEHFKLGIESQKLGSTHNHFFTAKDSGRQNLNTEKLKDLRSSHFVLGTVPANYSTSGNFLKPGSARVEPVNLNLRASHFKLGSESPDFKTSYIGSARITSPQPALEKNDSHRHLTSNFNFGDTPIPATCSQASFKPPNIKQAEKPDPVLMKNLRMSHFKLGLTGNDYKTSYSQFGSKPGQPSQFDEDCQKDLRSSHFKIGNSSQHLISSNQNDYIKHTLPGTKSEEALAKNLRKTHFSVGAEKGLWSTEHRTHFNWVQPVPDNEFKISLI